MPKTALDYGALEKRVREGDDDAMGELIKRYGPIMHRLAEQLIGRSLQSQMDATDLVQSVQITLWMGIRSGQFSVPTPDRLLALAKTLLTRQVARHWRTAKSEVSAAPDASTAETLVDENLFAAQAAPDPHSATEADDLLEKFMGQLDETDQQLVNLRLQGCSTAEAARSLQVDSGFLRVRLGRLRKKLAEFWQQSAAQS